MALRVEVSGIGVCRTSAPHAVFIISVQQERYEPWNVYRRFSSFSVLRDQLTSYNPAIQLLPGFDGNNFSFEYLEDARVFLDHWLKNLTGNTYILRMQSMYQFLCIDANMPPPYLEIFSRNHGTGGNGEDLEMDEMFDGDEEVFDAHDEDDDHDPDAMETTVFTNMDHSNNDRNSIGGRPGKHAARSPAVSSSLGRNQQSKKRSKLDPEEDDDAKEIQSLSVVEAEFIYDKKDEDKAVDAAVPRRTINLEAFKIIKVIGKGTFAV